MMQSFNKIFNEKKLKKNSKKTEIIGKKILKKPINELNLIINHNEI